MKDAKTLLLEFLATVTGGQNAAALFAEYMAHPTARATGRTVHHLFTGRLVAENGQIKLLRAKLRIAALVAL